MLHADPSDPGAKAHRYICTAQKISGKEALAAAGIVAAIGVAYVVDAWARGALGVARNDDWVYYRAAFETFRAGTLTVDPFTSSMLVGQIWAAQPLIWLFGERLEVLQTGALAIGMLGVLAMYYFVRGYLPRVLAAFASSTFALGPVYGSITTSFMTDAPSFALQMIALLMCAKSLQRGRLSLCWTMAGLTFALVAFTVREYALSVIVAIAYMSLRATLQRRDRLVIGIALLIWMVAATLLFIWRNAALPANAVQTFSVLPQFRDFQAIALVCLALGLSAIPLLIVAPTFVRTQLRHMSMVSKAIVATSLILILMLSGRALVGTYVTFYGSNAGLVNGEPPVLGFGVPGFLFSAFSILSLGVLGVAVWWGSKQLRSLKWPPVVSEQEVFAQTALVYAVSVAAMSAVVTVLNDSGVYDRYLLPAGPMLVAGLTFYFWRAGYAMPLRRISLGSGVLALLALPIVDASAALDGAKFRIASSVVGMGIPAQDIDGGYEWFGLHQRSEIVRYGARGGGSWWLGLFENPEVCVIVRYAGERRLPTQADGPALAIESARTAFGTTLTLTAVRSRAPCEQDH